MAAQNRILLPPYKDDALNLPRRFQTLIHEIYQHAPAAYTGNVTYATDAWFDVLDPVAHAAGKSSTIGIYVGTYLAFTLSVATAATPAGGVVTVEIINGAPLKGFDPISPQLGYTQAEAAAINSNVLLPLFTTFEADPANAGVWDAVSRHVVEEFSNLGRFLPVIYYDPKVNPLIKSPVDVFGVAASVPIPHVSLNKTGPAPDPPTDPKKAIYLNPPGPPWGTENPPYIEKKAPPIEGHQ